MMMKSDERMLLEVEKRMAMNEADRYKDPKCERLVPCALCQAEGDAIRKMFVPVDAALKLHENSCSKRTSIAISLCAKCMIKLLENNLVHQVVNVNELRKFLT